MSRAKIIAFDYGNKNIGIAIGQFVTCTAKPVTTLKAKNGIPNQLLLSKIVNEWRPTIGIVGLPLDIYGKYQLSTKMAIKFAKYLQLNFNFKILMHDERFTTIEAKNNLFKYDGYRALKQKIINASAAVIILESWMQSLSQNEIINILSSSR